tara:strand:+ start:2463 stop:3059 length:597 start_codon:yes stop_codon:yes gene_type:complete
MVAPVTHPLYFQFHWLSQCALRTLREYRDPFFHITLLDDYRSMSPLVRGSFVGCMFQRKLIAWLNMLQPGMWREGDNHREADVVCMYNSDFTFEVKTSCAKGNAINGNKVQAAAKKAPGFLLYVNYHADTLTIRNVRLGWCGPNDWNAATAETSQAARLKPEVAAQFVSVPIHGNLSMLAYTAEQHDRNETVMVDWHN